jgi:tetratricopeptide (TPR) repeat protein
LEGTRAEFQGKVEEARALYQKAWKARRDDYEACVAAHYVARFQAAPEDILFWNQEALKHANAVNDDSVKEFYPSLYLNLGRSYELIGNQAEAQQFYELAAELGLIHQSDP